MKTLIVEKAHWHNQNITDITQVIPLEVWLEPIDFPEDFFFLLLSIIYKKNIVLFL